MADRVNILLRHGPYGKIHAAEALRHAGGALSKGWEVTLILVGDGVHAGLPYHVSPGDSWMALSEVLRNLLDESDGRLGLFVHDRSLEERGLGRYDLFKESRLVTTDGVAKLLAGSGRTLIF